MTEVCRLRDAGCLSLAERRWRVSLCLGWPLAIGAVAVLSYLGDFPLCAFRYLSSFPCPLCGATHACLALLHGDVAAAWQANPGLLPLLAVAALHTLVLAREALSARRQVTARLCSWAWASGGILLLLAWGLRLPGGGQ